jgi:hypothetical protein
LDFYSNDAQFFFPKTLNNNGEIYETGTLIVKIKKNNVCFIFFIFESTGLKVEEYFLRPQAWKIWNWDVFGTTKMRDFWISLQGLFHLWTFHMKNFFELKKLKTISMFWNKLETGVASGADIRVQLIRPRILEEISTSNDIFF